MTANFNSFIRLWLSKHQFCGYLLLSDILEISRASVYCKNQVSQQTQPVIEIKCLDDYEKISNVFKFPKLKVNSFSLWSEKFTTSIVHCNFDSPHYHYYELLKKMINLESAKVSNMPACFLEYSHSFPKLCTLDLGSMVIFEKIHMKILNTLTQLTSLKIVVHLFDINPEKESDVSPFSSLTNLQNLTLHFLTGALYKPDMNRRSLINNDLRMLTNLTALEVLNAPDFTDDGLTTLVNLRNLITDARCIEGSGLKSLPELKSLTLYNDFKRNDALTGLTNLRSLRLVVVEDEMDYYDTNDTLDNNIDDSLKTLTNLDTLVINNNCCTDNGLMYLTQLTSLTLSGFAPHISHKSVEYLTKLKKLVFHHYPIEKMDRIIFLHVINLHTFVITDNFVDADITKHIHGGARGTDFTKTLQYKFVVEAIKYNKNLTELSIFCGSARITFNWNMMIQFNKLKELRLSFYDYHIDSFKYFTQITSLELLKNCTVQLADLKILTNLTSLKIKKRRYKQSELLSVKIQEPCPYNNKNCLDDKQNKKNKIIRGTILFSIPLAILACMAVSRKKS
ncbi:MAG: hypothetical protein Edafosvirus16_3 [Edafosvirus sp.]|uniref:Leucine-rich repeat protein n=1 Tax=Edafosvirus sp. TaxID=2487765 RepID=A0A3G4ZVX5_9VIRU|nr:MAG: hypothetical protein Edafosvirus16_3 [Edafosvirus sp.]